MHFDASSHLVTIVDIMANDRGVNIVFDKEGLFAQSNDSGELFQSENYLFSLPLQFSPEAIVFRSFSIFENGELGMNFLGEIVFRCCSSEYYKITHGTDIDSYFRLGKCQFQLPESMDIFKNITMTPVSNQEKQQLWKAIFSWDRNAAEILQESCHSQKDVVGKCALITQFIYSLDPPNYSSRDYLQLSLMNQIYGLQEKQFGMLCAGIRDLFIEIASVVIPDIAIRKANAFRCYYPSFTNASTDISKHSGMTINSHAALEVGWAGKWWMFDPYYRCYFTTYSGDLVNVNDIKILKKMDRLNELEVIHIPTTKPKVNIFEDLTSLYDPFGDNYFCYFSWINYEQFSSRN
jgi:hypothetical protein